MSAPLMMNALTVAGVSAGYGRSPVIAEVGFGPLRPGTVTALIGPNAAGKSTVLKTLTGILRARSGSARLGERELLAHRHADRAAFVRFVPQVFATNARLTVFDLVLVARMNRAGGARAARPADLAAVEQALTRVGIAHLADRMAGALSGGQQQLVALAQALAVPAPVLLLDEPTSALDLRNQLEALRILRSVAEEDGAIVIAALHDLTLAARHADHLVLMGAGRVLMEGSPRDVLCDACCGATYGVTLTTQMSQAGRLIIEASL